MLNRTVAVCERVTLGTDNDAQHTGDTRQAPKVIPSNQITDFHAVTTTAMKPAQPTLIQIARIITISMCEPLSLLLMY